MCTLAHFWPTWKLLCTIMRKAAQMGSATSSRCRASSRKGTCSASCRTSFPLMESQTRNIAMRALSTIARAMSTDVPITNLRSCCSLRTSLRCRAQPRVTRERWTIVGLASLNPVWLVNTDISWGTTRSGESARGSTTQTTSRKAWGRRFSTSKRPTTSLSVSFSQASMPELSKLSLTCCMILLGDRACMISTAVAVPESRAPAASSRKGLQLAMGARSQTFFTTLTKRLICFATFGVLSMTTTGLDILMLCSSFRFICGCQQ
mmetsp:Transcript_17508/g.54138  ORF Transcript_17508/g.54138 Transcript_17508/m.54138 type:complete len:263 (-) Transcript_17508:652-1440(-)